MGMNIMGMKQIIKQGDKLSRYMQSVDDDIKKLQKAFNNNMEYFAQKIDSIEKKLDEMNGHQSEET